MQAGDLRRVLGDPRQGEARRHRAQLQPRVQEMVERRLVELCSRSPLGVRGDRHMHVQRSIPPPSTRRPKPTSPPTSRRRWSAAITWSAIWRPAWAPRTSRSCCRSGPAPTCVSARAGEGNVPAQHALRLQRRRPAARRRLCTPALAEQALPLVAVRPVRASILNVRAQGHLKRAVPDMPRRTRMTLKKWCARRRWACRGSRRADGPLPPGRDVAHRQPGRRAVDGPALAQRVAAAHASTATSTSRWSAATRT